ncbi:MAG: hypothetical protein SGI96_06915 [Bacteroidota bacterium]|nr:hypothetical protein [Saprospiraceae bacterium]MDZ4807986.1 hypothetical protein [Bacteroidota bacterium]
MNFRSPLLPEDPLYIGSTLAELNENTPGISRWLQKVFCVLGGYIFTSGLFTAFIAQTSFRDRIHGVFYIVLMAGIASIGTMTVINFTFLSDFRWVLFSFTLPWFMVILLYSFRN